MSLTTPIADFDGQFSAEGAAPDEMALFTDLYELTMVRAYIHEGMMEDATFSLFVRRLPERRNFLLACGLDTVLSYLENLHFSGESIAYLRSLEQFPEPFLDWLREFQFTGEVRAVPEGTPIFANEPILEITAPLPEAQLVETFIMNQIHAQTVLASKAWRMASAAEGRPVVDFGPRRMHGLDASLKAARAFHVGGIAATSNVLAGKQYGVPVTGTMAHSYIQAHDDEAQAFRAFARLHPHTILLVDTYDTLAGVDKVIGLVDELGEEHRPRGIRLDSGDLDSLSRQARRALDDAGLERMQILASGGLDEETIARLVSAGAPIQGFGVGTNMGVSQDAPTLDIAYKLCEYAGRGRLKLSSGKPVLPGRKQIFRTGQDGRDVRDTIAREEERLPGRPLLMTVMDAGKRTGTGDTDLEAIRDHAKEATQRLPAPVRSLTPADPPYPVDVSPALAAFHREVKQEAAHRRGRAAGIPIMQEEVSNECGTATRRCPDCR